MPQLTLATHYGVKATRAQARFAAYVLTCQQALLDSDLGPYFGPYAGDQLHGTLVGLEAVKSQVGAARTERYNANLWAQSGVLRAMNFDRVLMVARTLPPLTIRFGGFQPDDGTIDSMGADAYTRSFQIQWRQRKVVIIGWHHVAGNFAHHGELWAIRRAYGDECGVVHKYADDSDFFVTIGDLREMENTTDGERARLHAAGYRLETDLRHELADPQRAIDLPLRSQHLSVIRYHETSLNPETSEAYPVSDPTLHGHFLAQLYTQ